MDTLLTKLMENGVLAAIVAVFLAGGWRLLNRYVDGQDKFLAGLARREELQQELCQRHAVVLEEVTAPLKSSVHDVCQLKQAALKHCEMCRDIVSSEFPSIAPKIDPHLREMEKLLS